MIEDETNDEIGDEVVKTVGQAVLKKLKEKADLYGIGIDWASIKTEEDLKMIAGVVKNAVDRMEKRIDERGDFLAEEKAKTEARASPHGPSGSVPLRGSDMGFDEGGYSSYSELFADLQKKAMSDNKFEATQAKQQLNQLTVKAMKALRDRNQRIEIKIPSDEELEAFGVHGEVGLTDILRAWWKQSGQKEKDIEKTGSRTTKTHKGE